MASVVRIVRKPGEIQDVIYQDFFQSLMFNTDTKDVNLLKNEDAIRQSIVNILQTNRGERHFNYNYGSDINRLLFEDVSPHTTSALIEVIKASIENFEPRINLIDIIATPSPEENAYAITIIFSTINKTEPITLEFLLNRVR